MKPIFKKAKLASVLGLAFDANRLEGAVVKRVGNGLEVQKKFSVPLGLNPLNAQPELFAQEIKNHLAQQGIREKNCVLALPLNWALVSHTEVPQIPEEDLQSFLDVEAERNFSSGLESLMIGRSMATLPEGQRYATLAAVPRAQLAQIDDGLRLAKLHPHQFTFAITSLDRYSDDPKVANLTLMLGQTKIDLLISHGGGIVALRSIEGIEEDEGPQKRFDADLIGREIRITLGNLPPELKNLRYEARIIEGTELPAGFTPALKEKLERFGMSARIIRNYGEDEAHLGQFAGGIQINPAISVAAAYLAGVGERFNFLPPRTSAWKQLTEKVSSKKLGYAGVAAAVFLILVGGAFAIQQWKLSRLRSQWAAMETRVRAAEDTQAQIKQFRPWFDKSFKTLSILRRVTEAFPEDGLVSAKTIEIRNLSMVNCSGVAQNNPALFKVVDNLREAKEVENVKIDQLRGKAPIVYSFNFQWAQGGGSER
ncbi:MAG: hypothetical protein ACO1QB_08440 [Verrucomicrobiales bacterium]